MQSAVALINSAKTIRNKFRNNPDAVPDPGIDLKKMPKEFQPQQKQKIDRSWEAYKAACLEQARRDRERMAKLHDELERVVTEHELKRKKIASKIICKQTIRHIAGAYGCSPEDITGSYRSTEIVVPRHIAIFLVRYLTAKSFPWIGREFDKDHTSILHAVGKIERRCQSDVDFAAEVAAHELAIRAINP